MKLRFEVVAHRDIEDQWAGQVLIDSAVVHEDYGQYEDTAVANARDSFITLLRRALKDADTSLGLDEPSEV